MREPLSYQSYAQLGEDVVVKKIFNTMKIEKPTFLDIGAFHPFLLSNTALLYERGSRGINVEPNPNRFSLFKVHRSEDINLQIGVTVDGGEQDYCIMSSDTLNTFSKEEAEKMVKQNKTLKWLHTIKRPTLTITELLKKHCSGVFPDFLNLDTEGTEIALLESIDWSGSTPKVICVESAEYATKGAPLHRDEVDVLLNSHGYISMCQNFLNTIFVKKTLWENR